MGSSRHPPVRKSKAMFIGAGVFVAAWMHRAAPLNTNHIPRLVERLAFRAYDLPSLSGRQRVRGRPTARLSISVDGFRLLGDRGP